MAPSPKDSAVKKRDYSKSPSQPKTDIPNGKTNGVESRLGAVSKNDPTIAEPLAPPPRPVVNEPDYFSGNHGNSTEINPFEHSFANGGVAITPGGTKLPSIGALTSPAPHYSSGITPGFWGGLRSGPLSPAMLSGPTKEDYFSDGPHLRGGFPTPNESGMRSGLTPGGGGSMFPEPSPGGHAGIYSQIAGGGATPGTLDFHRTAMVAAAQQKRTQDLAHQQITSQPHPHDTMPMHGLDVKPPAQAQMQSEQHDANDAANGLYLLANTPRAQASNGYVIAPQQSIHAHGHPYPQSMHMNGQSTETSPHMVHRNGDSTSTNSARGVSEVSDGYSNEETVARPNTRGKGKRGAPQEAPSNGRRKATDAPAKAPANKKARNNNGGAMPDEEPQSEEELDMSKDEYNANGKKMTDEEKRKNFLERNRVAALKCRQRKKQWLANLQQKVEIYSAENDSLQLQMQQMREEVVNLKTLLLAHKDCPVTQSQGMGAMHQMANMISDNGYNPGMNPYGMQQQQFMQNAPRGS